MATGTRHGEAFLRPGEKPTLPPPIPPRIGRPDQVIDRPLGHRYAGNALAVVATLDLDAIYRQTLAELPPSIRVAVTALGDPEWSTVCRQAIRTQERILADTQNTHHDLRRDDPWLLAAFLSTMRS